MTPGISGRLPWVFTVPVLELLVTGACQGLLRGSALCTALLSHSDVFGVANAASDSGDALWQGLPSILTTPCPQTFGKLKQVCENWRFSLFHSSRQAINHHLNIILVVFFFSFYVSKSWIVSGCCYGLKIYSQIQSLHSIQYFLLYMFKLFIALMHHIYLDSFNVSCYKIITVLSCLQNKLFVYDLYWSAFSWKIEWKMHWTS